MNHTRAAPFRIKAITIHHVRLPLKRAFRHARAIRSEAETIVVEALTDAGVSGFGEGVPREYVTGESPLTAMRYLAALDYSFCTSAQASIGEAALRLQEWETGARREGPVFPGAARCALGLSLLDALARSRGVGIGEILRCVAPAVARQSAAGRVRYSAVCSGGSLRATAAALLAYRLYGFRAVKLKVGWGEGRDVALVKLGRRLLGSRVDIRVDANGSWDTGTAMRVIPQLGALGVSSVEEPLIPECEDELPQLRERVGVPIMLDESVCDIAQARRAMERGACDMVNIRLSKCGGLFASMALAGVLRGGGVAYQLGCQVGESGILSAAGRHFAFLVPQILHLEGSYDRHLLKENIVREDVTFGHGGWAAPLDGPGLAVTVNRRALDAYTVDACSLSL
jgi:muconate cycloisomerase